MARCHSQVTGGWPLSKSRWSQGYIHGLNHTSSQGGNRSRATCLCTQFFSQISQCEFAAFPTGKALGGPAPTAHAVGQGSGNAALFESLSRPGEGGLCGQGVRWNVPTSIPGPTLRRVPRVTGGWPLSESQWSQEYIYGSNYTSSPGGNRSWATCLCA